MANSVLSTLNRLFGPDPTISKIEPLKVSKPPSIPQNERYAPVMSNETGNVMGSFDRQTQQNVDVPAPQPSLLELLGQFFLQKLMPSQGDVLSGQVSPTPTVMPTPTPTPTPFSQAPEIASGINYARSQMPPSSTQTVEQYYPTTVGNKDFMSALLEADKLRPGLANLLLGIAFNESTLGNLGPNTFGVLPGGEGAGNNPAFPSPVDALRYELSPSVLGGGGNPNMNILSGTGSLTSPEVQNLMGSYNPSGSYTQQLLDMLFQNQGR